MNERVTGARVVENVGRARALLFEGQLGCFAPRDLPLVPAARLARSGFAVFRGGVDEDQRVAFRDQAVLRLVLEEQRDVEHHQRHPGVPGALQLVRDGGTNGGVDPALELAALLRIGEDLLREQGPVGLAACIQDAGTKRSGDPGGHLRRSQGQVGDPVGIQVEALRTGQFGGGQGLARGDSAQNSDHQGSQGA